MAWIVAAAYNYVLGKDEDDDDEVIEKERSELGRQLIDEDEKDGYLRHMYEPRMDFWFNFDEQSNVYYFIAERADWELSDTYCTTTDCRTRLYSRAPSETLLKVAFAELLENCKVVPVSGKIDANFIHQPVPGSTSFTRLQKGNRTTASVFKSKRHCMIAVVFYDNALSISKDEAGSFAADLGGREKNFLASNKKFIVRSSGTDEKVVELRRKIEKNRDCWVEVECELPEVGMTIHPHLYCDSTDEVVRKLKSVARQLGHEPEKYVKCQVEKLKK